MIKVNFSKLQKCISQRLIRTSVIDIHTSYKKKYKIAAHMQHQSGRIKIKKINGATIELIIANNSKTLG